MQELQAPVHSDQHSELWDVIEIEVIKHADNQRILIELKEKTCRDHALLKETPCKKLILFCCQNRKIDTKNSTKKQYTLENRIDTVSLEMHSLLGK